MADDFQAKSDAFMAWLSKSAVTINPKILLADLRAQHAGRGVVAAANLEEDEVLFAVPRPAILTTTNSELSAKLASELSDFDPWLSLILAMLYEWLQGDNSRWKPYFDVLPTTFDTLMFWSPPELAELQASAVVSKIGKDTADATFRENLLPIIARNADVFFSATGAQRPSEEDLLQAMHRMGSLIMAYAFDIEHDTPPANVDEEGYASEDEDEALPKGMVPLADMLNADADRNNARLFYEEGALVMKAIKPIAAGEEIFNDYGPLPRSDLLRRYGYITPNYAQYDVVEIPHELVLDAAAAESSIAKSDIEERAEYLEEEGVTDEGYDITKPTDGEPLSESFSAEMLTLVTGLLLPKPDFQRLKDRAKIPKIGDITAPIARVLLHAIKARASQYPTTIENDISQLDTLQASDQGTRRRRMAIEVRLGEKYILRDAQSALTELLDGEQNQGQAKKRRIG